MDRRIKLAKKYFVPRAAPMQKHTHACHVCKDIWEHTSTRCARKGHRNKICVSCVKKGKASGEIKTNVLDDKRDIKVVDTWSNREELQENMPEVWADSSSPHGSD